MARSEPSTLPVRLQAIRYGAEEIVLYEFEPTTPAALPPVTAGSHVDIGLPGGLLRQYSLITPLCSRRRYVIAVKREEHGRGGSRWLHDSARVGQLFELSSPRNHFEVAPGDSPVLLLAGGIGITPIYSMYEQTRACGRPVHLHYWCRSQKHGLFLEALADRGDVTVHYAASAEESAGQFATVVQGLSKQTEIYCCGPQGMLDHLEQLGEDLNVMPRIHLERFQAAPASAASNNAFEVTLARSGTQVRVASGQTILDALRDAGADVMYSCEQGLCGACEVRVLEGCPDHRDTVCSAEEHDRRGTMIICCSSSQSARLVLDI
ncbi:PDR/VanB family oxidoreductase [Alcanivorax xiamenensis]|uniref:PDR/VanB family oxidoreductase n=1 Tax=Alcanivorax xiamenensis TaxID=1177156 RepID=UPI0013589BB4|nr:PDR/VanB family oxidoreductase [Alcanivorax xiamenensis]